MSTRSIGMVGKTYKTASEAFKNAHYATAISRGDESEYSFFWGFMGALAFLAIFIYGAGRTIGF